MTQFGIDLANFLQHEKTDFQEVSLNKVHDVIVNDNSDGINLDDEVVVVLM